MTINRNNYETYFLLYIDNELSVAERKMVDEFIQQHTDLQTELIMLQQTVLKPGEIRFENKSSLLKTDAMMQEKLLLHLDGELNTADRVALNKQLLADASLRQEWGILQQTKLPYETVAFEHKEVLLRREPARIVAARWWRVAAAVFIGFGLLGTILIVSKNKLVDSGVAVNKNKATDKIGADAVAKSDALLTGTTTAKETAIPTAASVQQNDVVPNVTKNVQQNNNYKNGVTVPVANSANNLVATSQNFTAATKEIPVSQNEITAAKERLQNFNNNERNETSATNVLPTEIISQPAATEPVTTVSTKNAVVTDVNSQLKTNNATYAVTTKNDEGIATDYLAPDERKNRRSGLLRKVSRFLQRSTKKKGDGDGLKVAGFEFAVR